MVKKKTNPWIEHVRKYSKANPKKKYSECLAEAALTYNKLKGGKK